MKIPTVKFSEVTVKQRTSLGKEKLLELTSSDEMVEVNENDRPKENFLDLITWATDTFEHSLKDKKNLNSFIHNTITIDEEFLNFCSEKKLKIEPLYKQPIVSWKSETGDVERFFCQGVFKITGKNVEFLQCSLMHKGSNYEDEISFFIIASANNYEGYLQVRDDYSAWMMKRNRNNNYVRVVGGQDIKYEVGNKWNDLFLPDETKKELQNIVEGFLSSKEFYQEKKIPWKRGILLYGPAGTGKSSIIKTLMSEYDFKPVTVGSRPESEDIIEAFNYAEEQSPSLLYFEDLDSLLEVTDISLFLNLMDGISAKNGLLVVATANEVKKLKSNITNRPSRFDRKFEIGLPDSTMSLKYLKKWFGSLLSVAKYKELVKFSQQHSFSYAYLKELYISSMFEAMANKRKLPNEKDVNNALNRLIKDKNLLEARSISMDNYLNK